jgi:hypothetical protein
MLFFFGLPEEVKHRLIPGNSVAIERPLGAESVNERPVTTAASQTATATAKVLLDRHPHFHGGAGNSTPETIWS